VKKVILIVDDITNNFSALTAGYHELRNSLNNVLNYAEGYVELTSESVAKIYNQSQPISAETVDYLK